MNSSIILSYTTFVYGMAAFLYIFAFIFKKDLPGKVATWFAAVGLAGNIAGFFLRWIESYQLGFGRIPLSNLYESLVFFAICIAIVYLIVEQKYKNRVMGAFTFPLAFLSLAYASLSPNISDRIQPLVPALKSNWLTVHVITCFIGYAAFAIAFGVSIMFILRQRSKYEHGLLGKLPSPKVLDELTYRLVLFGFLFLTIGILSGAVWANSAWGRYWGWDPKETWSLITWFVYATLIHARMMRGWNGKRVAWLSVVGFGAVMFTYFGVNLLPGLHSYAATG